MESQIFDWGKQKRENIGRFWPKKQDRLRMSFDSVDENGGSNQLEVAPIQRSDPRKPCTTDHADKTDRQ